MYDTGRRKWITYIIMGVLVAALIGSILIAKNVSDRQKKEIDNLNTTITSLQQDQETVYATTEDVKAGQVIEMDKITTVSIPQESVPENAITKESQLEGKRFKISLKANSYLTKNMLLSHKLNNNQRELDIVLSEIPIGLEVGDYVDIRVTFPEGQNYTVMSHKQVTGINGNTLKIVVIEQDFYRYESVKTDMSLYASTRLYATKYLEPGIQKQTKVYYPPRFNIAKQSLRDPNMHEKNFKKLLKSRKELEEQLASAGHILDKNQTVTDKKTEIQQEYNNAREEYEELKAEQEAEQAGE